MKFSSVDLKKLNELRSALLEGIRKCGEVVLSVNNEPLRKTIMSLEQQSNQYANELNAQIQVMGGYSMNESKQEDANTSGKSKKIKTNIEEQALKICRKIEKSVINLYKKTLKEELANDGLKKMMKYQMDGIMCTTLQLKLLSKFLHNQ
ncbi:MAG TPA: hypothetical protein VKT28_15210 [Puia sp.]|nr:hypothetical protein [Puia sp.]